MKIWPKFDAYDNFFSIPRTIVLNVIPQTPKTIFPFWITLSVYMHQTHINKWSTHLILENITNNCNIDTIDSIKSYPNNSNRKSEALYIKNWFSYILNNINNLNYPILWINLHFNCIKLETSIGDLKNWDNNIKYIQLRNEESLLLS